MNCKKCDQEDIDAEAYNAPGGGFLCRQCYRQFQWKSVGIGLGIAAVGMVAIMVFFILMIGTLWA
jgi:hypothetical protein